MKAKYQLGQIVESLNTGEKLTIKDFEVFDDLILYYLEEGSALPESQISTYGLKNIKKILLTSNEEKNRQINEVLYGLDKELDKIFKNA
jgi:hypothetical protein